MKNLRRLGIALTLCTAFALPAFAGEVNAPPCPDPGEMSGPPCRSPGEVNGPPAPGDTQGPSFATSSATGETDPGETQGPTLVASMILFALGGGL